MMAFLQRAVGTLDTFQQEHVWLGFPVAVSRKLSDDQGGNLAALIAYYGFLSIFPLLLAFAAILGFVLAGHPALQSQVLRTVDASFPALPIGKTVSGSGAALGIGLAGSLWGGLGVTLATERAMNNIWDVPLTERPNLWVSRLRGIGMLCLLGATFLVSTALAASRGVGGALAVPAQIVGATGPLVLNFGLYLLAFQVLTNRHLKWTRLWPGAVAGSVGWTALQNLGAFYVRHEVAHASQLYGSLAVVVGLLAWIYLGARLTLLAAETNVVLAFRLWPRSLRGKASTEADKRALVRQARQATRAVGEEIAVSFGEIDEAGSQPVASVPAPSVEHAPAGTAQPSEEKPAVDDHIAVVVVHLQQLRQLRQEVDACEDAVQRQALLGRLRSEAGQVADGLVLLARDDKALQEAIDRLRH